jgi:hypothetical protein
MHVMKCQKCGAECPPGTSYCRQCGAPVDTGAILASEQTTTLLGQNDGVTTQRLESRETGPGRWSRSAEAVDRKSSSNRRALLISALVIVVVGVLTVAGVMALRNHRASSSNLSYPGARTVLDMTTEDGRALHLQTSDSVNDVEAWYRNALNSQKVVRLTPSSVILKSDRTTVTVVAEGGTTNILIKMPK